MLEKRDGTDRSMMIDQFLIDSGFGDARRDPLQGDASFRRYERIWQGQQAVMLMDAPPPKEDVRPFVVVTKLLRSYGFSAPEILFEDEKEGFLLLEDLGNDLFSAVLKQTPECEYELYQAAVDVLIQIYHERERKLHQVGVHIPPYDTDVLLREVALVTDWFMPQAVGVEQAKVLRPSYVQAWTKLFESSPLRQDVPVLRDYHADNLMWLPDREGVAKVGLLDYQDALLGDPAYDLVSFLEDIRRHVAQETIDGLLEYYLEQTRQDKEEFMLRYAVLGAQRNSKIVGIFTRLCVRDGKPNYLNWMPNVWRWLEHDLSHPALGDVSAWFDAHVTKEARGVFEADVSIGSIE